MSQKRKDNTMLQSESRASVIAGILLAIGIGICISAAIFHASSAEHWYADQHDEVCEQMLNNAQECECCNAFIYLECSTENPGKYPHYADCARKTGTAGCRCHLQHESETKRLMK